MNFKQATGHNLWVLTKFLSSPKRILRRPSSLLIVLHLDVTYT